MNIQEINSAIIHGSWSTNELNSIIDAVKFSRKLIREQTKHTLNTGDRVTFRSSKTGAIVIGRLVARKIKYATVDCGTAGRWRVPFEMLSKVED